ncbi:manganese-dependent inorganic pyrophosphatase [Sporolactobacillus inulinus]|uniref:Probable manganese-dependent inorganic pyrophosphatase n=1 Tax=Sporolactobacillus inulinus CASD TaxID=1069536 RepID=A0A0U1QRZ4_9BACL|nr:manganese-dependent inorganic pyrophosphatase [Sporolactobacillus inulinus]KLI03548.1 inorganic pyrophosphatase [Sporolactobacillus inulinus CASD]GEB76980.1 manganese-dependent inorganic pyrophosphatase [Sporolactobacillus inulinus]
MGKVLVFGHKSPDTDAICSAIAFADLKKQLGEDVEAVRLGDLNGETEYVVNHFGVAVPRLIKTVANEVPAVYLVDHNERAQSADDIEDVEVLSVVDHHRIANFETKAPLFYRAEPVGCTATIINKLYKEAGATLSKTIAGLMLSSIISDTLLFKSPTCTDEDVKAAKELEAISGVDVQTYGLDMLKAGTNIADKSAEELITLDMKPFEMGKYAVEIAQVNVVDTDDALSRQAELESAISKEIEAKNLDLFVLAVTNILTSDSQALILGKAAAAAESAFKVTLDNHVATLKGVVSRKKQIVPVLTESLAD